MCRIVVALLAAAVVVVPFVVWACLARLFCVQQTSVFPCYNPHGLHVCLAPTQRARIKRQPSPVSGAVGGREKKGQTKGRKRGSGGWGMVMSSCCCCAAALSGASYKFENLQIIVDI